MFKYISITALFFCMGSVQARYSSPSFNFGEMSINPAVNAYYFKNMAIGLTHNMSLGGDEYQKLETSTAVNTETEYSYGGQDILFLYRYSDYVLQFNYSPTLKETKVLNLKSAKTYYTKEISKMNLSVGYQLSKSIGLGLNYDSFSYDITGGSSEEGVDYYTKEESLSKFGFGSVYNGDNVYFVALGANIVSSEGDDYVSATWQETYLSATYVLKLYNIVSRFQFSYILTPEVKEIAAEGKNINYHRQSKEIELEGEFLYGDFLIPITYNSKSETAFSGGDDKKSTTLGVGCVYKFPKFNVAGNFDMISSEEGVVTESSKLIQINFTYGI